MLQPQSSSHRSRGAFPFRIQNTSISVIDIGHKRVVVSRVNDTCHLTNPRRCTREDFERIFAGAI